MRTKKLTQEQIREIIRLYVDEKLSTIKIGEKFNIGKKAINSLLRKNDIKIRTASESIYKGGRIESNKRYREKDGYVEKQKEYMKTYYPKYCKENKDKIKQKYLKTKINRNEKHKERIENDSLYKLTCNIRNLIKQGFYKNKHNKKSKTSDILGCTFEEFKKHIESLWQPWMNWDNYGNPKDGIFEPNKTWDIDHVIPISTAKTTEDVIKLNHYSNLQPLCSYHNRFIKRDNQL